MKILNKLLKVVNCLMFIFFVCFMIFMIVTYDDIRLSKFLNILCILPLVMVPYLLGKIKLYHMSRLLIFFYYLFILLSTVMGSLLGFYYKIWWFDLLVHFISGIVTSIIAVSILESNKLNNKKFSKFIFVFILVFSISIAGCWEYLEFICDKLFNTDTQWVGASGVDDTMTDMLIATLASLLSSIYYLFYLHKDKV